MAPERPKEEEEQVLFADDFTGTIDEFPIRKDMDWKQKREAELLLTISRGVMLVTGAPGSGKDLFSVSTAYLNKFYFGRRVLLDFLPFRLFGNYMLFNGDVMMQEINKMAKMSHVANFQTSKDEKEKAQIAENIGTQWAEGEGSLKLQGAILYLQELRRYCHNRNPHGIYNKFIGGLLTQYRHLDMLVIGTHIFAHEIDRFSFLPYVNYRAKCSWSLTRPHTTDVSLTRGSFITNSDAYSVTSKLLTIHVNGSKPQRSLNGDCFFNLYPTKNMVNLKPVVSKNMLKG